jgi:N-acetyl-anhydromuramyl-L-alanine amidase AmpD
MQKSKLIIVSSIIILLFVAVFGWVIFSKKKTVQVSVQNSVTENQQTINSNQESAISNQEIINSNNQESDDSQQKTESTAQQTKNTSQIINRFVSWGFQKATGRKIDTIIIHSTYDASGNDPYSIDGIIAEYKQYGVSPHYLIARDGTIYHLVADQNIAYHAGVSKMPDGRTDVNDFSIGIEMVNTMDGKFTDDQYNALNQLIVSLKKQYPIKYILGHSDIAPGRKTDPWNIDWSKVNK